jgi:tetratricopeptide (TPR) repeat protein
MKISSPKLNTSNLPANAAAHLRCQIALELKDKGEYESAQVVMHPLWKGVGARPEIEELHPEVAVEVLLCAGILTSWIGSQVGIEEAQKFAKNLIGEAITFYQSIGDLKQVAGARAELAYCHWREGALDEARIMFNESLQQLSEGNTRARVLLRLAILEWSASRYSDAFRILNDNAHLFKKTTNHAVKGNYHNQLAIVLRNLGTSEKRDDYFQRAIIEYQEADRHFKKAHNITFRADVKNNLGFLLFKLSRHKEALKYVAEARRLAVSVRDRVGAAQFDDTRAQILIAEGKLKEAETVARGAVRVLDKSAHQCLLADALITHGVALARLGKSEQAQFTFKRAIEVGRQVGALNKAGLAALTMIEELDDLSRSTLQSSFQRASEWLAKVQSKELVTRFTAAANKVYVALNGELTPEEATEALLNRPFDFHEEVLKLETTLIRRTLAKVNGSVTRAAKQMGMSYQGLAYIIQSRHPKLLKERTPVRRRSQKKNMPSQRVSQN